MKARCSVLVFFAILVLLSGLEAELLPETSELSGGLGKEPPNSDLSGNGGGKEPPNFWEMRMRLPKTYSKESRRGFKKSWPRSMCGRRFAPC